MPGAEGAGCAGSNWSKESFRVHLKVRPPLAGAAAGEGPGPLHAPWTTTRWGKRIMSVDGMGSSDAEVADVGDSVRAVAGSLSKSAALEEDIWLLRPKRPTADLSDCRGDLRALALGGVLGQSSGEAGHPGL